MAYFEFPHTRSYEGDLGFIIKKLTDLINEYNSLAEDQKRLDAIIAEIEAVWKEIIAGDLPEPLKDTIYAWLTENASDIIAKMIKNVYFGLTDAGYFTAYIPDSWKDITFKTTEYDIIIPIQPEYGHLVLQY